MKMVAASKLRRAQEAVLKPRPYSSKLSSLISHLADRVLAEDASAHPLLQDRPHKKNVEILALTSDRGLCGSLNSSVVRAVQALVVENNGNYDSFTFSTAGKKGYEGLVRSGFNIRKHFEPQGKTFDLPMANTIAEELCQRFLNHEVDAVFLVYTQFKSAIAQEVVMEQLLPVVRTPVTPGEQAMDYFYEPNKSELLDSLVPKHFASRLFQSFLESFASEQGARMTAMDNATRNAKEMTERLTLQYNRARQAAITRELVEIISGAEAL